MEGNPPIQQQPERKRRKNTRIYITISIIIIFIAAVIIYQYLYQKKIRELETKLDGLLNEADQYMHIIETLDELEAAKRELDKQVKLIGDLKDRQTVFLEKMDHILQAVPDGFDLNKLSFFNRTLHLAGHTKIKQGIIDLCANLEEDSVFKIAKFQQDNSQSSYQVVQLEAQAKEVSTGDDDRELITDLINKYKEDNPEFANKMERLKKPREKEEQDLPDEVEQLESEIEYWKKEIDKARKKEPKIKQIKEEIEAKQKILIKLKEILPESFSEDKTINTINQLANKHGIRMEKIGPIEERPHEVYYQYKFFIKSSAPGKMIIQFVYEVLKQKQIFNVDSIHLQTSGKDLLKNWSFAEVEFSTYSYNREL
jgi:Tfp pilus assembly protein PilO/Tfp pilus assembly protein PilN